MTAIQFYGPARIDGRTTPERQVCKALSCTISETLHNSRCSYGADRRRADLYETNDGNSLVIVTTSNSVKASLVKGELNYEWQPYNEEQLFNSICIAAGMSFYDDDH